MAILTVIPLVDEGMASSAYPLDLDDARALAVDASRVELGALTARAADPPDEPLHHVNVLAASGPQGWADTTVTALETGR